MEGAIPETTAYLALGLTIVVVVFGALIGRMWLKHRSLTRDEAALLEIQETTGVVEERQPPA